ncbi:hypothetical protein QBC46DRAFT_409927 [Diplogelasinospora grovesii]|uniref:Uncharacterized protein n=1 Tax=Diplogelasinospora grovesii TaxID=303347 RepID=A0AAN6N6K2_9PEZI|nr:hypothetical protein QBC46DRAFT_409927 [Diplogelasinospora grovesii]
MSRVVGTVPDVLITCLILLTYRTNMPPRKLNAKTAKSLEKDQAMKPVEAPPRDYEEADRKDQIRGTPCLACLKALIDEGLVDLCYDPTNSSRCWRCIAGGHPCRPIPQATVRPARTYIWALCAEATEEQIQPFRAKLCSSLVEEGEVIASPVKEKNKSGKEEGEVIIIASPAKEKNKSGKEEGEVIVIASPAKEKNKSGKEEGEVIIIASPAKEKNKSGKEEGEVIVIASPAKEKNKSGKEEDVKGGEDQGAGK